MNSLIELLNQAGQSWAGAASGILLQSSVLIVVLCMLDWVLRRRVRAVVRYGFSLLILLKLMLPPSLALPTGLGYWLKRHTNEPVVKSQPTVVSVSYTSATAVSAANTLSPIASSPALNADAMGLLAAVIGSAGLLIFFTLRARAVAQMVSEAKPASEDWQSLLHDCCLQLWLKPGVEVRITERMMSPAVCGLWRPVILIPQKLAHQLTEAQRRAVLLHELAHLKRGDVWVNYLQTLLQVAYWWHPLTWFANAHIRRLREQAVDERVMAVMKAEQGIYPETLLAVARFCLVRPLVSLGLVGIIESQSALKQRIQRIVEMPVSRQTKFGVAGAVVLVLLAAALLPMAEGQGRKDEVVAALTKLDWQPWSADAVKQARQRGKVVFVDFMADWDATSQYNLKTSIEVPATLAKLKASDAVAFKADYTHANPEIEAALKQYGRGGVPLTLVYPTNVNDSPLVLAEVLTPTLLAEALDKAAVAKPAAAEPKMPRTVAEVLDLITIGAKRDTVEAWLGKARTTTYRSDMATCSYRYIPETGDGADFERLDIEVAYDREGSVLARGARSPRDVVGQRNPGIAIGTFLGAVSESYIPAHFNLDHLNRETVLETLGAPVKSFKLAATPTVEIQQFDYTDSRTGIHYVYYVHFKEDAVAQYVFQMVPQYGTKRMTYLPDETQRKDPVVSELLKQLEPPASKVEAPEPAPVVSAPAVQVEPQILIEAKFLELTMENYNRLRLGKAVESTNGFYVWIMSAEQVKKLFDNAQKMNQVDILSAPRVITTQRQSAKVAIEEMASIDLGNNQKTMVPVGVSLEIGNPEFAPDRHLFTAILKAEIKEFIGYEQRSGKRVPNFRDRVLNYGARIPEGSTIILGGAEVETLLRGLNGESAKIASKKRLLVCVTPQVVKP